jgi:hypothetical protein
MTEANKTGQPLGLASTDGLGPTAPYVPVLERGPQDTAHSEMMRLLELSRQQAAEIVRLQKLLQEPARGRVFAGWFAELPSGMSYRLWEQGGHSPDCDEVPLYV